MELSHKTDVIELEFSFLTTAEHLYTLIVETTLLDPEFKLFLEMGSMDNEYINNDYPLFNNPNQHECWLQHGYQCLTINAKAPKFDRVELNFYSKDDNSARGYSESIIEYFRRAAEYYQRFLGMRNLRYADGIKGNSIAATLSVYKETGRESGVINKSLI